jgi:hypothetical protein
VTSSTIPIGSTPASSSESDVSTPIYDALAAELRDPETVEREFDEFVIRWYLAHGVEG